MNSTSSDSIDFLDVAAATATVAGCLATLAALIGVIMHRNASFCAAFINFMCCCRKRSNRVASSLHLRRAGGVLAELGGVVVHPPAPASSGGPPRPERSDPPNADGTFVGGPETTEVENIYIEPLEIMELRQEPPRAGGNLAGAPLERVADTATPLAQVFNLISPAQHIALELAAPPLAGRAKKLLAARNDSFKM